MGAAISGGAARRDCSAACSAMSAPALGAFHCGSGQVRVGAAGDHGHDSRNSQLRAFLDRPLHAVELEDGEQERDVGTASGRNFFAEFKLDPAILDAHDASAADCATGGDIEFLPYAGAQDADR